MVAWGGGFIAGCESSGPLQDTGVRTYSKGLRLKVLSAVDRGMPRKEVVEVLDVSLATIKRWLKRPEDAKGWFVHCGYEAEA